jgi:hypothetical protein
MFSRRDFLAPHLAAAIAMAVLSSVPGSGRADNGTVPYKTPSTVFLNLDAIEAGAPLPALPLWVESFEIAGSNFPAKAAPEPFASPRWDDPAELDFLSDDAPGTSARDPIAYREQQLLIGLIAGSENDGTAGKAGADPDGAGPSGVTVQLRPENPAGETWTVARLQLRSGVMPGDYLFLRVLFDDMPGQQPVVTSWAVTGEILFRSKPLGAGTGLPSSEGLLVPTRLAGNVEIAIPGSGANLRSLFLSAARSIPSIETVDFAADGQSPDPFGQDEAPSLAPASSDDSAVYGRVLATLDPETVPLSPLTGNETVYEFELAESPMASIFLLEALNADAANPPVLAVNGIDVGPAAVALPDLADPAYSVFQYNASTDLQFRYTGWARAQKFLPGSLLRSGLNRVVVRSGDATAGIAIRNVRIQLKYAVPTQ